MYERRQQYYTDQVLQGYLLIGLVVVQLVLVLAMLLVLYWQLNQTIENHFYRIHTTSSDAWPELFQLMGWVFAVFLLVDLVVLAVAHGVWGRYLNSIVRYFSRVLDRIIALDFTEGAEAAGQRHRVAVLVEQWFAKEQARYQRIRILLARLPELDARELAPEELETVQTNLAEYRRLLHSTD